MSPPLPRCRPTLVLIGPHGAGKSTLGRALALRLGLPFHAELGMELAADPAWRPAGATAADAAAAFDLELFARELARDLAWAGEPGGPRIVETWHPGNLAYAARRSPRVAAAWLPALARAARAQDVLVLPLTAPRRVLARRQHEPGELDFFLQVGAAALSWARGLGLPCLPVLDSAGASPERLAARIAARLSGAAPRLRAPRPAPPRGG